MKKEALRETGKNLQSLANLLLVLSLKGVSKRGVKKRVSKMGVRKKGVRHSFMHFLISTFTRSTSPEVECIQRPKPTS